MSELKTAIAAMLQAKFVDLAAEAASMGFTVTHTLMGGFRVDFNTFIALPAPKDPLQEKAEEIAKDPVVVKRLKRVAKTAVNAGKTCAEPGCEKDAFCRGLCPLHYGRWRAAEKAKAKKA